MSSQTEFVAEAEAGGVAAGLSLDIFTPFESLETSILSKLNVIQIMGGQLGEQGNQFNPLALEKIKLASGYRQSHNLSYKICVDVGMNPQTIPQVKLAGADAFVVGSYLFHQVEGDNLSFQSTNYQIAWDQLLSAVKG
jgi:ribulose-phosphate 3-epimerase